MSQSQRWGKVVTIMPVPNGEITTSEILVPLDEAIAAADAEVGAEELEIEE
jgi:hypothetical protein